MIISYNYLAHLHPICVLTFHKIPHFQPPEMVEFELQHCKCQRKLKRFTKTSSLHDTTCSRDAYHRGEGQKVIGFSYYRLKDKSSMVQKSIR